METGWILNLKKKLHKIISYLVTISDLTSLYTCSGVLFTEPYGGRSEVCDRLPLSGRWTCVCWWETWSWWSTNQRDFLSLTPFDLSSLWNTRWSTTSSHPRGPGVYRVVWYLHRFPVQTFYTAHKLLDWLSLLQEAERGSFGSNASWWTGPQCPRRVRVWFWSLHITDC